MFNDNFMPTIGVDFKIRTIDVDGKTIKLQIGTPLVRRDLRPSPAVIIRVPTELLSPTTSPTESLSQRLLSG